MLNFTWSPACLTLLISPLSHLSPPERQQRRRIGQACQNHREKVEENKILQVFAHLGRSSPGFKAPARLFGGAPASRTSWSQWWRWSCSEGLTTIWSSHVQWLRCHPDLLTRRGSVRNEAWYCVSFAKDSNIIPSIGLLLALQCLHTGGSASVGVYNTSVDSHENIKVTYSGLTYG